MEGGNAFTKSTQLFVESVEALDKNKLIELVCAYRDAFNAYCGEETGGGKSLDERAKRLTDSEKAFIAAYESVEDSGGNSAMELYELLTDEEKTIETVKIAKETLDDIIIAVAEIRPIAEISFLGQETTVKTFSELQSAINNAGTDSTNPTIIEIGANFDLTAELTLTGKHVKLTSANGGPFTLTRATNFTGIAFAIKSGGSLTLDNIKIDGNKSNVTSPRELISVVGTTFTMEDGAVLQDNKSSAITMSNMAAKVYIHGGSICGNESEADGGAISDGSYSGALIEISGGEIKGNKAAKTGGAIKSTNAITIIGGTISGNTAGATGGGISKNGGILTMTGGVIQENTATTNGDNVYLLS